MPDTEITTRGNSQLVIRQMFDGWKIKKGLYVPLAQMAKELLGCFRNVSGEWVPYHRNGRANALAMAALDQLRGSPAQAAE